MSETFTCDNCGATHEKGWSDAEAAAEAEGNFPGMNISDPAEAALVCDDCYQHIMGRVRAEAPELTGPGWRAATERWQADSAQAEADTLGRFLAETCAECGTPGPMRHLSAVGGCRTCAADDPRPVYTPVRNLPHGWRTGPVPAPAAEASPAVSSSLPKDCYRMPGGSMVHVKPGCRCP